MVFEEFGEDVLNRLFYLFFTLLGCVPGGLCSSSCNSKRFFGFFSQKRSRREKLLTPDFFLLEQEEHCC